jgi:hypothetical protein
MVPMTPEKLMSGGNGGGTQYRHHRHNDENKDSDNNFDVSINIGWIYQLQGIRTWRTMTNDGLFGVDAFHY